MSSPGRKADPDSRDVVEVSHALEGPFGEVALVDLLNRVLDRGVVLTGDVTVSVAGIDLLHLDLRLLLSSVETLVAREVPTRAEPTRAEPHGREEG